MPRQDHDDLHGRPEAKPSTPPAPDRSEPPPGYQICGCEDDGWWWMLDEESEPTTSERAEAVADAWADLAKRAAPLTAPAEARARELQQRLDAAQQQLDACAAIDTDTAALVVELQVASELAEARARQAEQRLAAVDADMLDLANALAQRVQAARQAGYEEGWHALAAEVREHMPAAGYENAGMMDVYHLVTAPTPKGPEPADDDVCGARDGLLSCQLSPLHQGDHAAPSDDLSHVHRWAPGPRCGGTFNGDRCYLDSGHDGSCLFVAPASTEAAPKGGTQRSHIGWSPKLPATSDQAVEVHYAVGGFPEHPPACHQVFASRERVTPDADEVTCAECQAYFDDPKPWQARPGCGCGCAAFLRSTPATEPPAAPLRTDACLCGHEKERHATHDDGVCLVEACTCEEFRPCGEVSAAPLEPEDVPGPSECDDCYASSVAAGENTHCPKHRREWKAAAAPQGAGLDRDAEWAGGYDDAVRDMMASMRAAGVPGVPEPKGNVAPVELVHYFIKPLLSAAPSAPQGGPGLSGDTIERLDAVLAATRAKWPDAEEKLAGAALSYYSAVEEVDEETGTSADLELTWSDLKAAALAFAASPPHGERPEPASGMGHTLAPLVQQTEAERRKEAVYVPKEGDRVEAWRAFDYDENVVIGWTPSMQACVGRKGTVKRINRHGDPFVDFGTDAWWWHLAALRPTSDEPGEVGGHG